MTKKFLLLTTLAFLVLSGCQVNIKKLIITGKVEYGIAGHGADLETTGQLCFGPTLADSVCLEGISTNDNGRFTRILDNEVLTLAPGYDFEDHNFYFEYQGAFYQADDDLYEDSSVFPEMDGTISGTVKLQFTINPFNAVDE